MCTFIVFFLKFTYNSKEHKTVSLSIINLFHNSNYFMYKIIKNHIHISVLLVYSLLSIITFWKLPSTFFQQDEWAIFGNYLYWEKSHLNWFDRLFMYEMDTHVLPLTNFFSYIQFAIFRLNFVPYTFVSIGIQAVNAFLVYYLSFLLTKQKKIGFVAGTIFLINSITHQATTWIATTSATSGSTFFILLSLIFFTMFIQKNKYGNLLICVLFLGISLLFKETGLFTFLFFPIFWFLYNKNRGYKILVKVFSPFLLLGITYILLRLYFLLFGYISTSTQDIISQPGFIVYIYRIFTLPLKFIAQSFIPIPYLISIASNIVKLAYPQFVQSGTPDIFISQSIGVDTVSYLISILILLICFIIIRNLQKRKKEWKLILLCILFISLSSLPFILIPGTAGYLYLIDGRHLYTTSILSSILFSIILITFLEVFAKKRTIFFITVTVLFLFGFSNMRQIRNDLWTQIASGNIRKAILSEIQNNYPTLPKKVIIYAQSDSFFYGLPIDEKILPFQSGFGQTLLVWYNNQGENFPACFFQSKYLYTITSEGYKECDGRGFGYFRKFESLKEAVHKFNIKAENIIAFKYLSAQEKLVDITNETRQKISL